MAWSCTHPTTTAGVCPICNPAWPIIDPVAYSHKFSPCSTCVEATIQAKDAEIKRLRAQNERLDEIKARAEADRDEWKAAAEGNLLGAIAERDAALAEIKRLRAALEHERAKFQAETLRTSRLTMVVAATRERLTLVGNHRIISVAARHRTCSLCYLATMADASLADTIYANDRKHHGLIESWERTQRSALADQGGENDADYIRSEAERLPNGTAARFLAALDATDRATDQKGRGAEVSGLSEGEGCREGGES